MANTLLHPHHVAAIMQTWLPDGNTSAHWTLDQNGCRVTLGCGGPDGKEHTATVEVSEQDRAMSLDGFTAKFKLPITEALLFPIWAQGL